MDERYREWRRGWEAPPEPPEYNHYDSGEYIICLHCDAPNELENLNCRSCGERLTEE